MVLEQIIDRGPILRHAPFVFFLSLLYVFVAYGVQELFFPGQSVATILLATLLLVPSLHHLICVEEEIERKGSSHFWKRHHLLFKCYTGAFFGLLAGFFILGQVNPAALDYQFTQLEIEHLKPEIIAAFSAQDFVPTLQTAFALFSHNVTYLLIGFGLSVFYGAGAIFLVVFNASFFAAFMLEVITRWTGELAAISLVHMIPESLAFILAAIAGATLSRGIIHEKAHGQAFRNVMQNVVIMMSIALVLLLAAAFIETYVTAPAFSFALH